MMNKISVESVSSSMHLAHTDSETPFPMKAVRNDTSQVNRLYKIDSFMIALKKITFLGVVPIDYLPCAYRLCAMGKYVVLLAANRR